MIDKAIGRRGLIGLFLGGAAAATTVPQAVTVKAAAAALGVSTDMPTDEIVGAGLGSAGPAGFDDLDWDFINSIERTEYAKRRPVADMPPHIANKKSWSHTFKASVFAKEDAIMAAYVDKLRRDRSFMDKMKAKFFNDDSEQH